MRNKGKANIFLLVGISLRQGFGYIDASNCLGILFVYDRNQTFNDFSRKWKEKNIINSTY